MKIEKDIAILQTAQKYYNIHNQVSIENLDNISLELAIKLLGSYGRKSKLFRDYAGESSNRRSYYDEGKGPKIRNKDSEYQIATITKQDALKQSMDAELMASKITAAISMANSKDIEITFLINM